MNKVLHAAIAIAMGSSLAGATETPIWDLAKDEIPASLQSGNIERAGNKITLKDGAAFAVPAESFPDQKNFTVQVTASVSGRPSSFRHSQNMEIQGDPNHGRGVDGSRLDGRVGEWWAEDALNEIVQFFDKHLKR